MQKRIKTLFFIVILLSVTQYGFSQAFNKPISSGRNISFDANWSLDIEIASEKLTTAGKPKTIRLKSDKNSAKTEGVKICEILKISQICGITSF